MTALLPDLVFRHAVRVPDRIALVAGEERAGYAELAAAVRTFAGAVLEYGLGPGERVAVFLEKRVETVVAKFGTSAAGGTFVPVNPLFRKRHVRLGD